MDIKQYMQTLFEQARCASEEMTSASTAAKNKALNAIAEHILTDEDSLTAANQTDLQAGREKGLNAASLDRLELTPKRVCAMAEGLHKIAELADLVGQMNNMTEQPSGIKVGKMRVPLGVVGIIYESRPNVTADAAGLCLKSGNAVILRGGSEALNSNQAIGECIRKGLAAASLPQNAVQIVATPDRDAVGELLAAKAYIDVVIPRGGKGLVERVSQEAKMPTIKHLDGICHVYIDDDANLSKAVDIAFNAKTQCYGTCNTMECLLVAKQLAKTVLGQLGPKYKAEGVEIRGCPASQKILPNIRLAKAQDYATEYLAPILSLKIVAGLDDAIAHINHYGSQHTDTIVTENLTHANRFLQAIDSSSVMVNTSTRFADGFEYGLGAEIGISTDKLHARGPVGLEGLTSEKFIVFSDGKIRT